MLGVLDRGKKFNKFFNSPIDRFKRQYIVSCIEYRVKKEKEIKLRKNRKKPKYNLFI